MWYTLAYIERRDHPRLARERTRVWTVALAREGVGTADALRHVRALLRWARAVEAGGRTPKVREQASWLERRARLPRPLPRRELGAALDQVLLRAKVHEAPGARETLERLRADGWKLGLVSNILYETSRATQGILDRLDLTSLFSATMFSADHPWSKPNPDAFLWAVDRLRGDPRRSFHIGDVEYDVVGARRAGLTPILYTGLHRMEIPRPALSWTSSGPPVLRASRWTDVPALLERLAAP
jgi:HAD superfamily hydrolase (TIGR01549 family)